jgi:hypothetical protein
VVRNKYRGENREVESEACNMGVVFLQAILIETWMFNLMRKQKNQEPAIGGENIAK